MKVLGAILAGGGSRRFGSDKAVADINGHALLDRVADGLRGQVEELVVVGRDWPGLKRINDRPEPGQGPLGGLCGALAYASDNGFDAVLTAGCDTLPVPEQLLAMLLGETGAVIDTQPLFGYWPSTLQVTLDDYLASQPRRNMRGWIDHVGGRFVDSNIAFHNINTPQERAAYLHARDTAA